MIQLKPCSSADIPVIYKLAEEIWYDHYPDIISHEQIDYMLKNFYGPEVLEDLMNKGQSFFLIDMDEIENVGYLAVTEKAAGHWFMNKFYIKTDTQRSGLGTEVLKQWETEFKPQELSLQVNRKNFKSINYYFKNGFTIKEVADFDIGNGYSMDDFIMVKNYKQD